MSYFDDWAERSRREWDANYGRNALPQRIEDNLYTPGVGHTGSPWPEGRGHDYCWNPFNCIYCGCTQRGPGMCHLNQALASGWRPTEGEGDIRDLLQTKAQWNADMARIAQKVRAESPGGLYRG